MYALSLNRFQSNYLTFSFYRLFAYSTISGCQFHVRSIQQRRVQQILLPSRKKTNTSNLGANQINFQCDWFGFSHAVSNFQLDINLLHRVWANVVQGMGSNTRRAKKGNHQIPNHLFRQFRCHRNAFIRSL